MCVAYSIALKKGGQTNYGSLKETLFFLILTMYTVVEHKYIYIYIYQSNMF